jgi:uncharacterized membrane protein
MFVPPVPSWFGLHPLVVHFPVALLLAAPVLVLLALFARDRARPCAVAALAVMAMGTIGAWVAVASGEAAGQVAERTPDITRIMMEHEELAETVRAVFTALTLVYAALILAPRILRREMPRKAALAAGIAFLALYAAACLLVADTAHLGGRLVHQYGVRSVIATE